MHDLNRIFWLRCRLKYWRYFRDPSRVVEFGSANVNGSIRDYFNVSDYAGVDWRPRPGVDVVSLAHAVDFPAGSVDTVVSASMLEHDPHWRKSLDKMVEVMHPDGILMLTWGAALNNPHELHTAPDGGFHSLKAGHVLRRLNAAGIHIHEFYYEARLAREARLALWDGKRGMGEAVLVAFKNPDIAPPSGSIIEDLIDEDMV